MDLHDLHGLELNKLKFANLSFDFQTNSTSLCLAALDTFQQVLAQVCVDLH